MKQEQCSKVYNNRVPSRMCGRRVNKFVSGENYVKCVLMWSNVGGWV